LSLLETIFEKDHQLLIFLNNLGNENWDGFWLNITNKLAWLPLYLFILFYFFKYYGWKKTLLTLFILALLVTFTDQFVNLIKFSFARLRPNKDDTIKNLIRVVKDSGGYSFLSGHATNSMAVSTFVILSLRSYFKPVYLILIWPMLFAYSRIYLGVHYPLDVVSGLVLGFTIGIIFYRINRLLLKKIN
jgi:undecaprenyl-diphosphatase